jgi:hypothetical protein
MGNSLTFVDWGREDSVGAPSLSIEHFNLIINQPENILFARKFEYEKDSKILSKLDSHLIKS